MDFSRIDVTRSDGALCLFTSLLSTRARFSNERTTRNYCSTPSTRVQNCNNQTAVQRLNGLNSFQSYVPWPSLPCLCGWILSSLLLTMSSAEEGYRHRWEEANSCTEVRIGDCGYRGGYRKQCLPSLKTEFRAYILSEQHAFSTRPHYSPFEPLSHFLLN